MQLLFCYRVQLCNLGTSTYLMSSFETVNGIVAASGWARRAADTTSLPV